VWPIAALARIEFVDQRDRWRSGFDARTIDKTSLQRRNARNAAIGSSPRRGSGEGDGISGIPSPLLARPS
jgi:hypothetical protein